MSLSHVAAGRSRNVDATRVFFPIPVDFDSLDESNPTPSTSSNAWKFDLNLRIWSGQGPKGSAARSVLTALLWSSDGTGRTWLGMPALMKKSGLGSERTVRKALVALTSKGWITLTAQTWASLTAEQAAVGRTPPRRGDVGQAPNLYTVLANPSPKGRPEVPTRPGLVRTTEPHIEETPPQICRGGQEQIDQGGPGANLHPDPDQVGSVSTKVSEEGAARASSTHDLSKAQEGRGDWGWLEAWQLVAQAHATKTTSTYGLAPMEPDVRRSDRKAMAECLDGASSEVAAKLRARGMERDLVDVRRDLAERAIGRYFRNDTPHLRKTKHALRDLPREWHARVTEAMQAILRESHDAMPSRRTPVLEQRPAQVDAPNATKQSSSAPVEKPMRLEEITALAQRAREMLEASTPKESPRSAVPAAQPSTSKAKPERSNRPAEVPEKPRSPVQKPAHERSEAASTVQRSIGRPGAPRWGTLAPTPTKVRRVSRLQLPEPDEATETPEPHPRE